MYDDHEIDEVWSVTVIIVYSVEIAQTLLSLSTLVFTMQKK